MQGFVGQRTRLLYVLLVALPTSSRLLANSLMSVSMVTRETVAVIGGGIAGTSFAQRLATTVSSTISSDKRQFQVTVFDTGRLRLGGRCSSRLPGDALKDNNNGAPAGTASSSPYLSRYLIDHAAQILTVPETHEFADFAQQVRDWETQGIVKCFQPGSVCSIHSAKSGTTTTNGFRIKSLPSEHMFYGAQGMGSLPQSMIDAAVKTGSVDVQQDVWVSPANGVRYKSGKWTVQASGKVLGQFDRLVIAHNGKCADRLMSKTPAKELHNLLKTNFAPSVPTHGGKRMTLSSIYSLTVALKKGSALSQSLPEPLVCGFVKDNAALRFLSCQTRKYDCNQNVDGGDDIDVWTILSSPNFAKKYKAPQEFLTDETIEQVSSQLLQALEQSLGLDAGSLTKAVLERRLQLWGAALPLNTWETTTSTVKDGGGYVYDSEHTAGVIGDWLVQPSIAGAWTSGQRLADFLQFEEDGTQIMTVGLEGSFVRSESASQEGIGALSLARPPTVKN